MFIWIKHIMWWIASNNGFSIHFTYNQLIFICKSITSIYIDWWIRGGVDVMTYFLPQLSKIVTISLNHSKGIYDSHLKQDMAAYGTFLHVYIFKGKLLKEGYHFPIISRQIICRVFQLQRNTNICRLHKVWIISRP